MKEVEITVSYQSQTKKTLILYGIFALVVIPVFTIIMGTLANCFEKSMSYMGNFYGNNIVFVIWTLVFCQFLTSIFKQVLMVSRNEKSKIMILVHLAANTMLIANVIPYNPEVNQFFAELHVFLARVSSVCLVMSLIFLTLMLQKTFPTVFKRALAYVLVAWTALMWLFSFMDAVSFTEMLTIICASVLLFLVLFWLYEKRNFASCAQTECAAEAAIKEVELLERKEYELHMQSIKTAEALALAKIKAQKLLEEEQ